MQRLLDGIERLGNKMPNPAILFLWLCLGVILLSQVLSWLDVKSTYEIVAPPPVAAEETYYGGSVYPTAVAPSDPPPAEAYEVRTETAEVQGLLSTDGVRLSFSLASVCITAASSAGDNWIPDSAKVGGGSLMCFFMIAGIDEPLNGTSPVSIW